MQRHLPAGKPASKQKKLTFASQFELAGPWKGVVREDCLRSLFEDDPRSKLMTHLEEFSA